MDYRKINSHIILLGIVVIAGLLAAIIVRLSMLENGADIGTVNLTFLLILGASAAVYLIIIATLSQHIIPWLMKLLSKVIKKPIPLEIPESIKVPEKEEKPVVEVAPIQVSVTVQAPPAAEPAPAPAQQEITTKKPKPTPAVDIEKIKQDADQQYVERLKAKVDLFHRYTHTVIGPYITAEALSRLDEYVECYTSTTGYGLQLKMSLPEITRRKGF